MNLSEITIRSTLQPGDLGYIIYRHGKLYSEEYNYGIIFEAYVAEGIAEFYKNYNPEKERVWVCEHNQNIVGFLLLMHRENNQAQLRYFYLEPAYRGIGLGKKLMDLYMEFLNSHGFNKSFLLTTHELTSAAALYRKYGFQLTEENESDEFGKLVKWQRYDLSL